MLLLSLAAGVAMAQGENKIYGVYVGGYLLMRLRTGTPELTLAERRLIVQQRATNLMTCTDTGKISTSATPMMKCTTKCVRVGDNYNVYANGLLIVTVTSADAKANKTTTYRQAKKVGGPHQGSVPCCLREMQPDGATGFRVAPGQNSAGVKAPMVDKCETMVRYYSRNPITTTGGCGNEQDVGYGIMHADSPELSLGGCNSPR